MNTFQQGRVRVLVYRDKAEGIWYATALELNLTIDGEDRHVVQLELDRAIREYVQSARELDSEELLNQEPDPELVALWEAQIDNRTESVESPYATHFAGNETLSYA